MDLSVRQRVEEAMMVERGMGRIVVHAHGQPKDKAMKSLIEMYAERLSNRGVRLEYHAGKLTAEAYVKRLDGLSGTLVLLDEGGRQEDSLAFAQRFETWQLSNDTVHLAIGPAAGWPESAMLNSVARMSLSSMTLPHELAMVVLVEQLYRASEIQRNTGYHKA